MFVTFDNRIKIFLIIAFNVKSSLINFPSWKYCRKINGIINLDEIELPTADDCHENDQSILKFAEKLVCLNYGSR